jgi:hypothetical protein
MINLIKEGAQITTSPRRLGVDPSDCGAMTPHPQAAGVITGAESATPAEAAAIVAALVRFARDSAVPAPAEEAVDPWWRAAVLEGVGCDDRSDDPIDTRQGWINA